MKVSFFVPGDPVAQPRHKVGKFGAYLPKTHPIHGWKGAVILAAKGAATGPPMACAVQLSLTFTLREYKTKFWLQYPTAKPDLDNLEKAAMDALTGVLWVDDCQVVAKQSSKGFAERGRPVGLLLSAEPIY